jgi:hypothetical protein
MTTFYCLRFETPPTWSARCSYLYPPGTGWPGYTRRLPFSSRPTTKLVPPFCTDHVKNTALLLLRASVWVPTWSLLSQSTGALTAAQQRLLSRCLFRSLCLATGLYATILWYWQGNKPHPGEERYVQCYYEAIVSAMFSQENSVSNR